MKKSTSIIAVLFLAAIPLLRWVIAPNLQKLPEDFSFTARIVSTDNFYNEENKEFSGDQYSKTEYRYETVSSDNHALVIKNIFNVQTPEGAPIFSIERLYGINRSTGAHVSELGDKKREGYLFAPRHLAKGEPFTYWHVNYDAPAQMTFVREEALYGLNVFRYETYYKDERIDQTANLGFLPGVGETRGVDAWVDGKIVKTVTAGTDGSYRVDLETASLALGDHLTRVREKTPEGNMSDYSIAKTFRVSLLAFPKADFNSDNAVTITDWSIFLFRWASNDSATKDKIDIDGSGSVDIADFSIFLKAMKL